MAVWSTEAVYEFIRLFRENPCLWKIKSKDYNNRSLRNMAYDELVEFCKKIGFASANRDFVSKKIQNLRGAFRKELKKVTDARNRSGNSRDDVYKPNLWYFDLLLFTKDQELPTPNISNMDDNSLESETSEQPPSITLQSQSQPPTNITSLSQQLTNITSLSQQLTNITSPPQQPTNITSLPHEPTDVSSPPDPDYTPVEDTIQPQRSMKRKTIDSVIDTQIKFMKVCMEALKRKEMTEFDGFSISVAKKLEKMNSVQALYAETLIYSILRKGILNQLTESTDICDKLCNKNIHYSTADTPRPLSPTSSVHTEDTYHVLHRRGGEEAPPPPTSEILITVKSEDYS